MSGGLRREFESHSVGDESVGTTSPEPYFLDPLVGFRNRGFAFPGRSCALREHLGEENRPRGIVRRRYPCGLRRKFPSAFPGIL